MTGPSGYSNKSWGHLNSQIRPYTAIVAPGLYAGFLLHHKNVWKSQVSKILYVELAVVIVVDVEVVDVVVVDMLNQLLLLLWMLKWLLLLWKL